MVVERLLRVNTYNRARIAQRSGNSEWNRVLRRYCTPAEPPVPGLLPMVRSTILDRKSTRLNSSHT